jgi:membrane-associated phospholipid phosphatase
VKSVLFALIQLLDRWDRRVSRRLVLSAPQNTGRDWFVRLGAHLGDTWLWILVTFWLWRNPRSDLNGEGRHRRFHGWLISFGLQIVVTLSLKQLVRRPRPGTGELLYGKGPDEYGFPSGHAIRMAVVASWAETLWPRQIFLFRLLALIVGWCRIRLGIHTVGDVVIGWLLGLLIVRIVRNRTM